jgi:hypothetical protein
MFNEPQLLNYVTINTTGKSRRGAGGGVKETSPRLLPVEFTYVILRQKEMQCWNWVGMHSSGDLVG